MLKHLPCQPKRVNKFVYRFALHVGKGCPQSVYNLHTGRFMSSETLSPTATEKPEIPRRKSGLLAIAGAVLSGVLLTLCFPPWNMQSVVWVALVPLFCAVWLQEGAIPARKALLLGYACGLVHFWSVFYWLWHVTPLGWFLLAFYLALFPAVWTWFAACICKPGKAFPLPQNTLEQRLHIQPPESIWMRSGPNLRAGLLAAAGWVALEWLRGWLFTGFGWNGLGVAMHDNVAFLQLASLTGVGGLSFLAVLASATAVFTVRRLWMELGRAVLRPHYDFNLAVALIVIAFSYGVHRVQRTLPSIPLRVALVQADIPQNEKWNDAYETDILQTYKDLTLTVAASGPQLIVWPEAATPRGIFNDQINHDFVKSIAQELDGQLLLGSIDLSPQADYNAAILIGPQAQGAQVYRKMHLVPFGEYVPFRTTFPLFAMVVGDLVPADYSRGTEPVVFEMSALPVRIAPLVCFEDTVGRLVRRFSEGRPNLLVNITNDGWFKRSAGAEQHLHNAVFRTVEMGLPMVRAANTGVTCVIDAHGRVLQRLEDETGSHFMRGTMVTTVEVPTSLETTIYSRVGEAFSVAALIISLAVTGHRLLLRERAVNKGT